MSISRSSKASKQAKLALGYYLPSLQVEMPWNVVCGKALGGFPLQLESLPLALDLLEKKIDTTKEILMPWYRSCARDPGTLV